MYPEPDPRNSDASAASASVEEIIAQLREVIQRLELVANISVPANGQWAVAQIDRSRQFFSVKEAAPLLGLSTYTTRWYCALGRIKAIRAKSGRGLYRPWRISAAEIVRVKDEGLLPSPYKRPRRSRPRRSA